MMWQRAVWLVLISFAGGLATAATASAAPRPFAPRFETNDTGNIAIAANTLMTCPDAAADCAATRAGTASPASANNNNAYAMRYVNADPAAPPSVFSSSRAALALPAGATVLKAMLYYGGDGNAGVGGAPPPNPAARNSVVLKAPGASGYQPLVALQVDDTTTDGNDFQGVVDVTDEVRAGGAGSYWVGNVQAGTGQDRQAGWSLVVAYRDTAQPPRNLSIFDGFQVVNTGNPNVAIPVSGFRTPPTGPVRTQLGFVAYEGDAGSTGDGAKLNTTTLSDPSNPARNFFNSAISEDGVAVTTKDPDYVNQLGFDAILTRADGVLANDDTSAVIRLTTGGETYFPGAVTFATELIAPDVELQKSVQDLNGGQVEPGDTLRYTVTATNGGPDDATDVVLRDPIPAGTAYAAGTLTVDGTPMNDGFPGSDRAGFDAANGQAVFWLGTGAAGGTGGTLAGGGGTATASFDVTVGAVPSGTVLTNAATADFVARTLGAPLTADSNAVSSTVAAPDLTIAKTPTSFVATAGTSQSFDLTVRNGGAAPTDGTTVTVSDAFAGLPPGAFDSVESASGSGWTCTPALPAPTPTTVQCSRSDVLAAGATYPPIAVSAHVGPLLPLDNILNTATVAGGGNSDTSNDSSTAVGQATTRADLQLLKTADRTTALTGDPVTFTLRVRNGGPSTAAAVEVADNDLAPNYAVDAVSSSQGGCTALPCALGSLASGDEATVTIRTTVTATGPTVLPVDNTASVSSTTVDPTAPNNSSTATVRVAPTADLRIGKTASPSPLDSTLPASYALEVHNDGPQDAADVVVTDPLPAGFVFGSAPGCTHDPTTNSVRCALGTIADGGDASVTISGTLAPSTSGTILTNTALVGSTTGDPNPANDRATSSSVVIPAADLELSKSVDDTTPDAGDEVTFTLRLVNHGPSVAQAAHVSDLLPAGLSVVSAPGCTVTGAGLDCDAGALAPGAGRDFPVTVTVADGLAGTTVTNTAVASSTTPDPVAANGTDDVELDVGARAVVPPVEPPVVPPGPLEPPVLTPPVVGAPVPAPQPPAAGRTQMSVRKRADRRRVRAGSEIGYRITVRTTGRTAARDVRVCDRPPSGLSLVRTPGARLRRGEACWTIARLAPGRSRGFRVVARAASGSSGRVLTNRARLSAANLRTARTAAAPVRVVAGRQRAGGVTG